MPDDDPFLDISLINPERHVGYLQYPSATGQILEFRHIAEWRDFLHDRRIRSRRVHPICAAQFLAALRIMLFAWADSACIKAVELMALRALESSLQFVYYTALQAANPAKKRKQKPPGLIPNQEPIRFGLARYLEYMETHDGLATVYDYSRFKDNVNSLPKIRNGIGHGDLNSGWPWGGLLETVRDIIEHAWRNSPELPEAMLYDNQMAESINLD
jgi:hypothetical protein